MISGDSAAQPRAPARSASEEHKSCIYTAAGPCLCTVISPFKKSYSRAGAPPRRQRTSPSRPPRQSQKGKAPSARNSTATLASLTRCVSPCAIGAHHRRRVEARLQLGATLRPADDASVIVSMKVYSPLVYSCRPGGHCSSSSSSGGDSTCSIGGGRRPPLHAASGDAISSGRGRNVLARVVVACKHSLSATPELPPRSVSFAA